MECFTTKLHSFWISSSHGLPSTQLRPSEPRPLSSPESHPCSLQGAGKGCTISPKSTTPGCADAICCLPRPATQVPKPEDGWSKATRSPRFNAIVSRSTVPTTPFACAASSTSLHYWDGAAESRFLKNTLERDGATPSIMEMILPTPSPWFRVWSNGSRGSKSQSRSRSKAKQTEGRLGKGLRSCWSAQASKRWPSIWKAGPFFSARERS